MPPWRGATRNFSDQTVKPPKPFAISPRKYTIFCIVRPAISELNSALGVAIARRRYDRDC